MSKIIVTEQEMMAGMRDRWPPPSVGDLFAMVRCDDGREWAGGYGKDFSRAWNECPRGDWLSGMLLALLVGLGPEQHGEFAAVVDLLAPPEATKGALSAPRSWTWPSVETIRNTVDGSRLLRAVGLG